MVNKKFENIKKKSQIFIKCVPILVLLLGQKADKLFFVQSQFYRCTDFHATYKLAPAACNQDVVRIAVGPQVSTVPILTEGMAPSFSMLPSVISITPYSSRSSPKCLLEPDTADVISQINSDMTLFLTSCRLRCKSRLASVFFSEMRDKKSVYVTLFPEGRTFSLVCLFANSTAAL